MVPNKFIAFYKDSLLIHNLSLDENAESETTAVDTLEEKIESALSMTKQDKVEVYLTIFKYIKVLTKRRPLYLYYIVTIAANYNKIEECIREIESRCQGFRQQYRETKDRKKKIAMLRRGV